MSRFLVAMAELEEKIYLSSHLELCQVELLTEMYVMHDKK